MNDNTTYYALVTGASSGIGLAYATILARDYHMPLLLVSNQEPELLALAQRLTADYGVPAVPHYADLAAPDAAQQLYQWCADNHYAVDVLINKAGVFFWQPLIEVAPAKVQTMLQLHMVTLAMLCRLFGADMCARRRGYILNMSSVTAWMMFPGIQCYNSTKAFVRSFSRSLWYEMRPFGVTVTTLTPGGIDTPLYGLSDRTRRRLVRIGLLMTPERFSTVALRALFRSRKQAMPGWWNHLLLPLIRHLPDRLIFAAMRIAPQYKNIPLH